MLLVDLTDNLIYNNFFRCQNEFSLSQKTGTVGTYAKTSFVVRHNSVHFVIVCTSHNRRGSYSISVNIICNTLPHYDKNKEYILIVIAKVSLENLKNCLVILKLTITMKYSAKVQTLLKQKMMTIVI